MARFNRHINSQPEPSSTERWLVSYADYMTLLFAFFVVMYALSIVKEEEFSVLSEVVEQVFENSEHQLQPQIKSHNLVDDGILEKTQDTQEQMYGSSIINEERGAELVDGHRRLSNLQQKRLGNPLASIAQELQNAISDEIETGQAQLEKDQDWLIIELSSSLLFNSGSAVLRNAAVDVLRQLLPVINNNRNYLRIRGYTDDLPINNELFQSNWHLSVARATSVVISLESIGVDPARMAIEGYGQYAPFADNATLEGRTANRKVIIAVSKYALPADTNSGEAQVLQTTTTPAVEPIKANNEIKIIRLPNGGIRVTTRDEKQ